jgi:catechol 2,3-dioxygenase-like lactoylglutathione lyase family enzyme
VSRGRISIVYAGFLGLRLIQLTVNFDDATTYHLYYRDGHGNPGTIGNYTDLLSMARRAKGHSRFVSRHDPADAGFRARPSVNEGTGGLGKASPDTRPVKRLRSYWRA